MRYDDYFVCPAGCVRLRGHIPEERLQHPHRLPALHVHLCCDCRAALQGEVLLLYRRIDGHTKRMPVSATVCFIYCICECGIRAGELHLLEENL